MAATLKCDTIQNASSATPNITLDTAGNATVGNTLAMGSSFLRNRIINGDMRVDQRNAGASVNTTVNASSTYTVDRWAYQCTPTSKFTIQQTPSTTESGYATRLAAGFTNYLGMTSTSAYTSLGSTEYFGVLQKVEGFNLADLNWGSATGAKSVTLSFWVYSSLTGTFGGSVLNGAANYSYPFSYSINNANMWEQKIITISGPAAGTWLTTNGIGCFLWFSLGTGTGLSGTANTWAGATYFAPTGATSVVGTNGATFYITGVQLEEGSVATPFERRQYGQELALCQRYCFVGTGLCIGRTFSSTQVSFQPIMPVTMRSVPSITTPAVLSFVVPGTALYTQSSTTSGANVDGTGGVTGFLVNLNNFSGMSVGVVGYLYSSAIYILSSEL